MSDETQFKLKLTGQGMNLERDVSAEVAQAIVSIVFGGVAPSTVDAGGRGSGLKEDLKSRDTPPTSVREFLAAHAAKRIPEQITTIGLFLKHHSDMAVFSKKDLVKAFEDAQEPVPKNLPRDIAWTVKNGWIAPKSGQKNSYYLTASGEQAALGKFPPDVKEKTKINLGARKKRKAKAKQSGQK